MPDTDNSLGFATGKLAQLLIALRSKGGWRRLFKNLYIDLRYGGSFLGGVLPSPGQNKGHYHTMNSDYEVLARIFAHVELRPDDIVVDVGCGKGRLFNFLLHRGFKNQAIGIEINPSVADFVRHRLAGYRSIEIICDDILAMEKIPGTVFYLFNPFSREILSKFLDRLKGQRRDGMASGRPTIIYYNSVDLDLFESDKAWKITCRFSPEEVDARHGGAIIELA